MRRRAKDMFYLEEKVSQWNSVAIVNNSYLVIVNGCQFYRDRADA